MASWLLAALASLSVVHPSVRPALQEPDGIEVLVSHLEQAATTGDLATLLALATADPETTGLRAFVNSLAPQPTRVVVKERDRADLEANSRRLLLEVFSEHGMEGRISTWRVDVAETPPAEEGGKSAWRIDRMERLTVISGLYRLSLDATQQFAVHDLTLTAPDLTLRMRSGSVFVAATPEGPTAVVLVGRGVVHFAPKDEAERTQIRIFSGSEVFESEFDGAFLRIRPSEFESHFKPESLVARDVSSSDLRRATDIFEEYVGKSLQLNLSDLSRDRWSLVPIFGDFIAELRTRRHGSLTYARTSSDAEDVSLFDRRRRRNISVYASAEKRATRGRFYSEDDLVDYDILAHDVEASFSPERRWIDGSARLRVRIRAPALTSMTLRLAESLTVRGVYAPGIGRLLHLRVVGQHSLIVNLPEPVVYDTELTLRVLYSGRLEPQELEGEVIGIDQDQEPLIIPLEPRYLYSNRSYWYPQSTVTDYAEARLRLTVPPEYGIVASGVPSGPPAAVPGPVEPGRRPDRAFVFASPKPLRYLACVISRFDTVTSAELTIPPLESRAVPARSIEDEAPLSDADVSGRSPGSVMSLVVQANPRQTGRARDLAEQSAAILRFYASLIGEVPYPSFTLAVTESELPGGHSPAYFAVLNQQLPTSRLVYRSDPVSFDGYPTFFLAHELAHQWWGQAIGWKNYHEQWLSEGFSQYFAALYAREERGEDVMKGIFRQMRRWGIEESPDGPIYLGYRLGHIKGERKVFRALVYNKGAMVLHMLQRLLGQDVFLTGLRRFYETWKFKKAGTDDFRVAMEEASGRELTAFFDAWIYRSVVPSLRFSHRVVEGNALLLRFEHRGEVVHVPVTVRITYTNGESHDLIVPVTERVVERTVPLKGVLRKVDVNEDHGALAEIKK